MQLSFEREPMLNALKIVQSIIGKKQSLPVLGCFLLEGDGSQLRITGSDSDTQLSTYCEVDSHEPFSICLPRRFLDIVRAFPDKTIVMISDQDNMLIKCGRSRFTLKTLSAEYYPALSHDLEYTNVLSFEQSELKELIRRASYAMATSDARYYLNGMMVEVMENAINFVSSDGHRMGMINSPCDPCQRETKQYVISSNAVNEMICILKKGDCELSFSDSKYSLTTDNLTFIGNLIECKYPDYRRVIPEKGTTIVQLPRLAFLDSVKRTLLVLEDKMSSITCNFTDDGLSLTGACNGQESEEYVECEKTGNSVLIGLNPHYIVDSLSNMTGDQVKLGLKDDACAISIEGVELSEGIHVIMPMRL